MKTDEAKKYHPTEEVAEAARMALNNGEAQQFWTEVAERLDEYKPKVEPRRARD